LARSHAPVRIGSRGNAAGGPWLAVSWRDLIASVLIAVVTPLAMLVFTPTAARSLGRRWLFLLPVWLAVVA